LRARKDEARGAYGEDREQKDSGRRTAVASKKRRARRVTREETDGEYAVVVPNDLPIAFGFLEMLVLRTGCRRPGGWN
jgi:hypothetical protein